MKSVLVCVSIYTPHPCLTCPCILPACIYALLSLCSWCPGSQRTPDFLEWEVCEPTCGYYEWTLHISNRLGSICSTAYILLRCLVCSTMLRIEPRAIPYTDHMLNTDILSLSIYLNKLHCSTQACPGLGTGEMVSSKMTVISTCCSCCGPRVQFPAPTHLIAHNHPALQVQGIKCFHLTSACTRHPHGVLTHL